MPLVRGSQQLAGRRPLPLPPFRDSFFSLPFEDERAGERLHAREKHSANKRGRVTQ